MHQTTGISLSGIDVPTELGVAHPAKQPLARDDDFDDWLHLAGTTPPRDVFAAARGALKEGPMLDVGNRYQGSFARARWPPRYWCGRLQI